MPARDLPPASLPSALYTAAHVRALDRCAIEEHGVPGIDLMERAGAAALDVLRRRWPGARAIALLCGTGNNGGDGFVVARRATEIGIAAHPLLLGDPARLAGDAATAWERMRAAGVEARAFDPGALAGADVVVDALFGTGLGRALGGEHARAVRASNESPAPCLAIDVPSGLDADRGRVLGVAVRAAATVTFVGLKRGLFTGAARDHCGAVHFDDLGIPSAAYARFPPDAERLTLAGLAGSLAPRARGAHKGRFGHVLVVGGEQGFAGAARIAGEAAARVGAGLVSVATRAANVPAIVGPRPELMAHAVEEIALLGPLLERATALAVGPGLGRAAWGRSLLEAALASTRPLVLDADALNLLAADGPPVLEAPGAERRVFTPHPGEAGRLLGCSAGDVEADRFAALDALVARFGGTWVLKGAGTLVGDAGGVTGVCEGGNPGMASGGMGDALTGVIAALLAQGLAPGAAARLGACLHAAAGDAAAGDGERGTLASDLMPHLRRLVNAS